MDKQQQQQPLPQQQPTQQQQPQQQPQQPTQQPQQQPQQPTQQPQQQPPYQYQWAPPAGYYYQVPPNTGYVRNEFFVSEQPYHHHGGYADGRPTVYVYSDEYQRRKETEAGLFAIMCAALFCCCIIPPIPYCH